MSTIDPVKRFEELKKIEEDLRTKKIQIEAQIKTKKERYMKELEAVKQEHNVPDLKSAIALRDETKKGLEETLQKLSTEMGNYTKTGVEDEFSV